MDSNGALVTVHTPIEVLDSVTVQGNMTSVSGALLLGADATPAFVSSGDADPLQLNPRGVFTAGVLIGHNDLSISRTTGTHVVVGGTSAQAAGTLRSLGGVRAAAGVSSTPDGDAGFSFDEDGNSGLFLDVNDAALHLQVAGNTRLLLPQEASSTLPLLLDASVVAVTGSLRVDSGDILLGPGVCVCIHPIMLLPM